MALAVGLGYLTAGWSVSNDSEPVSFQVVYENDCERPVDDPLYPIGVCSLN